MSNLNRLKNEFDAAKLAIKNRNLGSCTRAFSNLCKEMTDATLSVTIDPDLSNDQSVCFVFQGLTGSNNFQSRINVNYDVDAFYMMGFYPILIIPDPNNINQRHSIGDSAGVTRAVSPLRNYAARIMARAEVRDTCEKAWKQAFPPVP
jgi:hypothetical protein